MRVLRIALAVVAAILAGPLIFAAYYSVQAGCLLCLEGEAAGSAAETWLNVGLVVLLAGAAVAVFWKRRRADH
jgi:hypothetical protein